MTSELATIPVKPILSTGFREPGFTEVDRATTALPASKNPYLVYIKGLPSRESQRVMRGCLDRTASLFLTGQPSEPTIPSPGRDFPWWLLRYEHTAAMRSTLMVQARDGQPWAPSYVNMHLVALRRVLEEAWRLEHMDAETFRRAADIKNVKGVRLTTGRHLAEQEIAALLAVCLADESIAGVRDAAIIAVLAATGARRAEIAGLDDGDYDPGDRDIRIIGKGNKERSVPLHEVAAIYLGAWLSIDARPRGALFCPIDRWGKLRAGNMTGRAIGDIVGRRRRAAAVPPLSAHDFRRTLAGELLDRDVDLSRVQQILGHASPVTTSGYDLRPKRRRRAAIDMLSFPTPEDLRASASHSPAGEGD